MSVVKKRIAFKPIKGFENYLISENGEIISMLSGNNLLMKNSLNKKTGYYTITLRKDNIPYKKYIHRLIGENFIENNDETKNIINHIDGNKINNHYSNLEWCTQKENNRHARILKLNNQIGENHSNCKLEDPEIYVIKKLYNTGRFNQEELSKIFNVHQVHIGRILNKKRRV